MKNVIYPAYRIDKYATEVVCSSKLRKELNGIWYLIEFKISKSTISDYVDTNIDSYKEDNLLLIDRLNQRVYEFIIHGKFIPELIDKNGVIILQEVDDNQESESSRLFKLLMPEYSTPIDTKPKKPNDGLLSSTIKDKADVSIVSIDHSVLNDEDMLKFKARRKGYNPYRK